MYCLESVDEKSAKAKAFLYLLDLEREGCIEGGLFYLIGHGIYRYEVPQAFDQNWRECYQQYYQKAMEADYVPAYLHMSSTTSSNDPNKPLSILLEAEKEGLKDDRILIELVKYIRRHLRSLDKKLLGEKFENFYEMALYYSDILIQRRSPQGYYLKGLIYWDGDEADRIPRPRGFILREFSPVVDVLNGFMNYVSRDREKAVSVWEEADRLGLANLATYNYCQGYGDLRLAYKYVITLPFISILVYMY